MTRTRSLFGSFALGALSASAAAQPATYFVDHAFTFSPAGNVAEVRVFDFRHAWVRTPLTDDEEHAPQMQHPQFDPFGEDFPGTPGWTNTGLAGQPVPVLYSSVIVDPLTGTNPALFCVMAEVPPSRARACNLADIPAWTNQSNIPVYIQSSGYADANASGGSAAFAYAASTVGASARGGIMMANGSIQWIPGFQSQSVGSSADQMSFQDPVRFTATDQDGNTVEHVLLDIEAVAGGPGRTEWLGNTLEVGTPRFRLEISIPAGVIDPAQAGELLIDVDNGFVVASSGTGLFAAVAPPVGAPVPFTLVMPDIDLTYDLGLDPTRTWDVLAEFSGGGSVLAGALGCPADLAEPFGELNFFDLAAYLDLYNDQSDQADLAEPFGELNFFDLAAYVDAYNAGCPGGPG